MRGWVVVAAGFVVPAALRGQPSTARPGGLDSRVDAIVAATQARSDVAGAVVAVVLGDSVIHLRGYGIANRVGSRAVDPERTTFGLSSISKVFTALAVLRLVEQGRLLLDDTVGSHVRLPVLETARGREVRVSHLLTHSAGFDERTIGIAARLPRDIIALAHYLATEMPPVIREPGTTASYSNHGYALAGLLVERASGEPFAEYLRRNVLDPLGMRRSGFEQPLSAELERARALPYRRGRAAPVARIYFNDAPASALYSTGGDMARFMSAFLANDSTLSVGSVLRSSAPMRERQFANHAALNGLTFGFRERRDGGVRGLQQGGDWDDYTSDLILAPSLRLGVFVAMSGDGASVVADSIWRHLIAAHGHDGGSAEVLSSAHPVGDRADPTGTYRLNRYSRHTLAKLGVLTGAIREVTVTKRDGHVFMLAQALHPIGSGVYRREGGSGVAFRFDDDGRATHLFTDGVPYVAYERVSWYERRGLHLLALGTTFVVLLATLWRAAVAWPLHPTRSAGWVATWRWGMIAAAGGAVWVVVGLITVLLAVPLSDFQYGTPPPVRAVLVGGLVAGVGAGVALVTAVATAAGGGDLLRSRLAPLTLSLAAALFGALMYYWRLLPMFG